MTNEPMVRIRFEHERGAERLWAVEVGPGRYELRNFPFFVYGVSWGDVVEAGELDESGSRPFLRVVLPSGGSTYRVLVEDMDRFDEFWGAIAGTGCTFEGAGQRLLAVDVPPATDLDQVYELLEAGEAAGVWHFEEGHRGHKRDPER